jgi:hypothetical protein
MPGRRAFLRLSSFTLILKNPAMDDLPDANTLMKEIGPWLDAALIDQLTDGLWNILLDDDHIIEVELDDSRNVFVLSMSIGQPSPENQVDIYKTLLQTNALWRDTGGIRMAMEGGDEGDLLLMFDVPLPGLDVDSWGLRLHDFVNAALGWRQVVTKTSATPDEAPEMLTSMIRI